MNKKIINIIDLGHGESGKTKIVDYLSNAYSYFFEVCCKVGSGDKSSVISFKNEQKIVKQLPSGVFNKRLLFFIGENACIDCEELEKEINENNVCNKVFISENAYIITNFHKKLATENISPLDICQSSNYLNKNPVFIKQTYNECKNFKVIDSRKFFKNFSKILVEFEEGVSSEKQNTSKYFSSVIKSLSLNINECKFFNLGVFKSYSFKRRQDIIEISELDLFDIKKVCEKNSITHLAITKIDTLFKSFSFKVCINKSINGHKEYKTFTGDPLFRFTRINNFSDFSDNIREFLFYIEDYLSLPVIIASFGRRREQTVCDPVFLHD